MKIEGKIKKVETVHTETEEGFEERGKLVIEGVLGEKISFVGDKDIVLGYKIDETIIVSVSRANKTLSEVAE